MKAQEWFTKADRFVRSYIEGMDGGEFKRLFDRDASHAWGVVTREHAGDEEPEKGLRRLLYRIRIFFLGLSFKLSPARRLLFAVCMVLAVVGVLNMEANGLPAMRVGVYFLLSVAGLVFLLVLELADRVVVRDELEVARELQRELMPQQEPDVPGYTFSFSYQTANTIGGDYYDFLPLPDGRLAVVVGDASGHGIAAGILMAIANSSLKLGLALDPDPAAVVDVVNRALCGTGGKRAFMTLFCGILELESGRFRYVCAGHPYPMLRRADGRIVELGTGSLPLGIRPGLEFEVQESLFEPGDTLVLYTDGVVETLNPAGESFGFERLHNLLVSGGPSCGVHDRVLRELDVFRGQEPVYDDRSLAVISRSES